MQLVIITTSKRLGNSSIKYKNQQTSWCQFFENLIFDAIQNPTPIANKIDIGLAIIAPSQNCTCSVDQEIASGVVTARKESTILETRTDFFIHARMEYSISKANSMKIEQTIV